MSAHAGETWNHGHRRQQSAAQCSAFNWWGTNRYIHVPRQRRWLAGTDLCSFKFSAHFCSLYSIEEKQVGTDAYSVELSAWDAVEDGQVGTEAYSVELSAVMSRNTLDHVDSCHAVHLTSHTRYHLPVAPGHLGPIPRAWNLSP